MDERWMGGREGERWMKEGERDRRGAPEMLFIYRAGQTHLV